MRHEVESEIQGRVWRLVAAQGERVAAGDVLLILESMKMEIPVLAPADGTVKEILTKEEDVLDEGAIVLRLEV